MKPKIIDDQPMRRMFECRFRFGHCDRSFLSSAIYQSASAKIIAMSGPMFQDLSHVYSASTDTVHIPRLTLWVHWYRFRFNFLQNAVWVRFKSSQCWSIGCLDIFYEIYWVMLDWTGSPCIDTFGILCGSKNPIAIVFLVADESKNSAIICFSSVYSLTLRYSNGVKVDSGLLILWYP